MAGSEETDTHNRAGNSDYSRRVEEIFGWQTPTVVDETGRDYVYPSGDHDRPFLTLPGQAKTVPGTPRGRSTVRTGKTVASRLNQGFSLWLQGYPEKEWLGSSPFYEIEECLQRLAREYLDWLQRTEKE